MRYSIWVLLFACTALVAAQECSEDGPTVAAEGEACSATIFCDPKPKKATVSGDYGIEADAIAFLRCIKSVCVWDYSIENDEACEQDTSCKSGTCKGSKCETPKSEDEAPTAVDDDCTEFGICFGDNLVCVAGKCKEITTLGEDEEGCVDPLKRCPEGSYCVFPIPLTGKCTKQKDDDEACSNALGAGIVTFECSSRICNKDGKCAAGGNVGDECDGLVATASKPCAWNLWCDMTDANDKKCTDHSPIEDDVADKLCKKKDASCGLLTALVPTCGCDDEVLVCSQGKLVQMWSLEADAAADNNQACFGELWYDKAAKKCVEELACKKDADCNGASPYAGDKYVYCDCTDEVCKHIDSFSWECRAAEVTEAQKDWCTADDDINLTALINRQTVGTDGNVNIDFDTFKDDVLGKWFNGILRVADAQSKCYFGSVGVSGASMVVPTLFMMMISIVLSLTLM